MFQVRRLITSKFVHRIKRSTLHFRHIQVQSVAFMLKTHHFSVHSSRHSIPVLDHITQQRRYHSNSTNSASSPDPYNNKNDTNGSAFTDRWMNIFLWGVIGAFSVFCLAVFGYDYRDRKTRLRQLHSDKVRGELDGIIKEVVFGVQGNNNGINSYCYDIKKQLIELGLNIDDYNDLCFDLNHITVDTKHNARSMFKLYCGVVKKNNNNDSNDNRIIGRLEFSLLRDYTINSTNAEYVKKFQTNERKNKKIHCECFENININVSSNNNNSNSVMATDNRPNIKSIMLDDSNGYYIIAIQLIPTTTTTSISTSVMNMDNVDMQMPPVLLYSSHCDVNNSNYCCTKNALGYCRDCVLNYIKTCDKNGIDIDLSLRATGNSCLSLTKIHQQSMNKWNGKQRCVECDVCRMFKINNFDTDDHDDDDTNVNIDKKDNNAKLEGKKFIEIEIPLFNDVEWFWKRRPWAIGESSKVLVFGLNSDYCNYNLNKNNRKNINGFESDVNGEDCLMTVDLKPDSFLNQPDDTISVYQLTSNNCDSDDVFFKMCKIICGLQI